MPDLTAYEANYQPLDTRAAYAPKKKPGGLPGFLSGLLPIAGGGLGMLLGALGGPVGVAVGGAAGSALGEAAREGISGEKIDPGSIALQGAFGAIPGVGTGVKAAAGAARTGESILGSLVGKGTSQAVEQQAGTKLGNALYNKGANTEAVAGGFGVGERAPGSAPLGAQDSQRILQTLKDNGIGATGSARSKLTKVEQLIANNGKQIDKLVGENNVPLTAQQRNVIVNDYLGRVNSELTNPAAHKAAEEFASGFASTVKDVKGGIGFRRRLDKNEISYVKNPDATVAARQQAASLFRDVLSEHTNRLAPGLAEANGRYHDLVKAADYLKGGAKVATDISQGGQSTLTGRLLGGETAQAAKGAAGRATQILGRLAGGVPAAKAATTESTGTRVSNMLSNLTSPGKLVGAGVKQTVPRVLTGAPLAGGFADETAPQTPVTGSPQAISTGLLATAPEAQQQPQTPFTAENIQAAILQDMQTTGGKNIGALVSLYNTFGKSTEKPLSAESAKVLSNAQTGIENLDLLQQQLAEDPSLQQKQGVSGTFDPFGLVSGALGTGQYQAARAQIKDVIARLRTGAAITSDEQKLFEQYLPEPGDSAETVQQKLGVLRRQFEFVLNRGGSAGSDLQTSLAGA